MNVPLFALTLTLTPTLTLTTDPTLPLTPGAALRALRRTTRQMGDEAHRHGATLNPNPNPNPDPNPNLTPTLSLPLNLTLTPTLPLPLTLTKAERIYWSGAPRPTAYPNTTRLPPNARTSKVPLRHWL